LKNKDKKPIKGISAENVLEYYDAKGKKITKGKIEKKFRKHGEAYFLKDQKNTWGFNNKDIMYFTLCHDAEDVDY